jgi:hypothetical protein
MLPIFGRHGSGSGYAKPEQDMKMYTDLHRRGLWPLRRLSASPRDPFFPPASATAAVGVSAANYNCLFQLLLFRAACFNFCGSALSTIIAHLVQSSLVQLLWFGAACVSCCESDSYNCWKTTRPAAAVRVSSASYSSLGSDPAGQGIQVQLLESCALGNSSWRGSTASNSSLGQEHPIIM